MIKQKLLFSALAATLLFSSCSKDKDNIWDKQGIQKPKSITKKEQAIYEQLTQGRQLKVITLPNELQVALISDPGASTSSASMDVAVGELSNPLEYRGMAHYLEHMLFLGTKKYPEPDQFMGFTQKNGGGSNAYTADENTNYFFTVNHSAFEKTLDMFADFFVEPTFNPQYIPKEIETVDSEYQKNRESTFWRLRYMGYYLSDDNSPLKREFQGSNETLGNVPRQVLLDFFSKFYSANQMKLAVISPLPFDKLEALVREKFSSVKNNNSPTQNFAGQPLNESYIPSFVEVKSADMERLLILTFRLPSDIAHYAEKPLQLLSQNLGYFGPGSLDADLKKRGLITGMEFDSARRTYGTDFRIYVSLTEKGSGSHKEVVKGLFSLLKQLKAHGLKKEIFDDAAQMAKLNYIYGSPARGDQVKNYSNIMRQYGAENMETKMSLYTEFNPELYQKYINLLTPENVMISMASPEVNGQLKADYYDIEYNLKKLKGDPWLKELQEVPAGSFVLLEKNPFVTRDTTLLDSSGRNAKRLVANEYGIVWAAPSRTPIPKATINLSLVTPELPSDARTDALDSLYAGAQKKMLEQWADNAATAGIGTNVGGGTKTFSVKIEGFSEKLGAFTSDLAQQLKEIKLDEEEFAHLREGILQSVEQAKRGAAYESVGGIFGSLLSVGSVETDAIVSELKKLSLAELKKHASDVARQARVDLRVFGNISEEGAKEIQLSVAAKLGTLPIAPELRKPHVVEVSLPVGSNFALAKAGETNNNVWNAGFQFGESITPKTIGISQLAAVYLNDAFFSEMRTNRSLGYIVYASATYSAFSPWLKFLIQSAKSADELAEIALPWIQDQVKVIQRMSEEEFNGLKKAMVERLRRPIDSYKSEMETFERCISVFNENWNYRAETADALEALTKQEFAAAVTQAFAEQTQRKLTVFLSAAGKPLSEMKGHTKVPSAQQLHQSVPNLAKPVNP